MVEMKNILIVEDDPDNRELLEEIISYCEPDCIYTSVDDGEEALKLLKKDKFDIILLDLMLPKKDGFSVLADLKTIGCKTPVVVSSNLSQGEDMEKAKSLGAKGYFVKSNTSISNVVEQVKKILA